MKKVYDNTNRGILSRNTNRKSDSHPEFNGTINVEGKDYWLSAWVKEGNKGKFFSLSVKEKEPKAETAQFQDDREIPF